MPPFPKGRNPFSPNPFAQNPFAPNFNDLEKEFSQLEAETTPGVKKYNKNEIADLEAEFKAMEEEELKDVDFEKGQVGVDDEKILQEELAKQVKALGPDKGDTKLTQDDINVITNTISEDIKNEELKKKIKGKKVIRKESMDEIFSGLKDLEE